MVGLSQGDGLYQDPVPDARLQATRRGHVRMTPDDVFNVKRKTAEVKRRGVRTRATKRSTSLVSTAAPRATEPNTRTSRKPHGSRPRESASELPEETRDPAALPPAVDLAQCVLPHRHMLLVS